jgi:DNA polymerase-3 subunit alpha
MTSVVECLVFGNVLSRDGAYVTKGGAVYIKGKYSTREDKDPQILADEIRPLGQVAPLVTLSPPDETAEVFQKLWIKIPRDKPELTARVLAMLTFFPGTTPVTIYEESTKKRFGGMCSPAAFLLEKLRTLLGSAAVIGQ